LRDYRFFIRRNSLQGYLSDVRPGADSGDTSVPFISNVVATAGGSDVTITWDTNEDALGLVELGLDDYYGRWSAIESTHAKSHSRTVVGLGTATYHYRVVAKDLAGNVTKDGDRTFSIP